MTEQTVVLPRTVVGKVRSQNADSGGLKGQEYPVDNLYNPNWQVTDVRQVTDTAATMRELFQTDGMVSSVIVSMVSMAMSGYRVYAFDTGTRQFSQAGQAAAESLMASWDTVWDYTTGYAQREETRTLVETALLEVALTGGIGAELVLNKARIPDRVQLFPYDTIRWEGDGKGGKYPTQQRATPRPGEDPKVNLNIPTVWVGESMKAADLVYNLSFLASGFKRLFHYDEFIQDMRRVVRQSGSPRIVVTLDIQKTLQAAPAEVQQDQNKRQEYLESTRVAVEDVLKDIQPEDALVVYDTAAVDSVATAGEKADYRSLLDALSGLTASAMKANPSILGLRVGGSQNVASTESLLFTKVAQELQLAVSKVLSRALTLGSRLMGVDTYVKFFFNSIELRPELELEANKSIRQNRILEQLSLGFLSDDEAGVLLGTGSRPPGAPPLSGTFFYSTKEPSSLPSPNADPNGRQVASDMPTSVGGRDQEKRA